MYIVTNTAIRESGGWVIDYNLFLSLISQSSVQRKETAVSVSNRKELNTEDYAFMKPLGEDGGEEIRELPLTSGF